MKPTLTLTTTITIFSYIITNFFPTTIRTPIFLLKHFYFIIFTTSLSILCSLHQSCMCSSISSSAVSLSTPSSKLSPNVVVKCIHLIYFNIEFNKFTTKGVTYFHIKYPTTPYKKNINAQKRQTSLLLSSSSSFILSHLIYYYIVLYYTA